MLMSIMARLKQLKLWQKILLTLGLLLILVAIAIGMLLFAVSSPSASVSRMKSELKFLGNSNATLVDQSYRTGSCFDVCSYAYLDYSLAETVDPQAFFQTYSGLMTEAGYTTTSLKAFNELYYQNGKPSHRYHQIVGEKDNGYQLTIDLNDDNTFRATFQANTR
jgi:hypothetical protein